MRAANLITKPVFWGRAFQPLAVLAIVTPLLVIAPQICVAQQQPKATDAPAQRSSGQSAHRNTVPEAPLAQVVPPDADKIVLLVRLAILTLNDAVQTGNFTVLRDRAAPSFRSANTAASLSQSFNGLTSAGVDLSMVALMVPQLTITPSIDSKQRLRITGYFPGQPIQIDFDLLFEAIDGTWRLFGLSVNPAQARLAAPAIPQPTAKVPSAAKK